MIAAIGLAFLVGGGFCWWVADGLAWEEELTGQDDTLFREIAKMFRSMTFVGAGTLVGWAIVTLLPQ